MKLTDFLIEEAIIDDLKSETKEGAIEELVTSLRDTRAISETDTQNIFAGIMAREEISTTALGRGVALPHARDSAVSEVIGVLGRSSAGIDFSAIDGDPVHAIILIVSPPEKSQRYLEVLTLVSKLFGIRQVCRLFREASDREALLKLVNNAHEYLDD